MLCYRRLARCTAGAKFLAGSHRSRYRYNMDSADQGKEQVPLIEPRPASGTAPLLENAAWYAQRC